MNTHTVVYVLIGQRAAGKSTYAKKLKAKQPGLQLINRDDVLMQKFGRIDCDHYSGNLEWGEDETWRQVKKVLSVDQGVKLVLDHWFWTSHDRRKMIERLQELGATKVIALYFRTPVETVSQWFWLKPKIAKVSEMRRIGTDQGYTFYLEDSPMDDHVNFHRLAESISTDGFDSVVEINPLDELIYL